MTQTLSFGQWTLVYLIAIVAFLVIDGAWLMTVMKPMFTDMLGQMLRDRINLIPAAIFYLFYVVAVLIFAVAPALETGNWVDAAWRGALLGLIAYGTYDMTNLSTLRNYKLSVALIDTGWGGAVSAITASIGFWAAAWITG
ncbi:MAG: DUF2177 family protein [Pseudomonadota bacterium]